MRIIELILDEENEDGGVYAISIVEQPAIESDFIALAKEQTIELAEVDHDKRILMGAALIPNKTIYRRNGEEEFYVYFSKNTIRKASEMFLKSGSQSASTLEHEMNLSGLTVVESWIVESAEQDKTALHKLSVPIGTWMVSVKVDNEDVWQNYVKTGKVKGFSIEGYFADKTDLKAIQPDEDELSKIDHEYLVEELKEVLREEKLQSYSDYPDSVSNNAKRGIELNKKVNNKCATQVGKIRAQQLANKKPISKDTIKRMFSYLSRAETYYEQGDTESCGYISFLLWGGKSAKTWSESKLKQLDANN